MDCSSSDWPFPFLGLISSFTGNSTVFSCWCFNFHILNKLQIVDLQTFIYTWTVTVYEPLPLYVNFKLQTSSPDQLTNLARCSEHVHLHCVTILTRHGDSSCDGIFTLLQMHHPYLVPSFHRVIAIFSVTQFPNLFSQSMIMVKVSQFYFLWNYGKSRNALPTFLLE